MPRAMKLVSKPGALPFKCPAPEAPIATERVDGVSSQEREECYEKYF